MNIIPWVHISDIHYKKKYEPYIKHIMTSLLEAIQNMAGLAKDSKLTGSDSLLFVTGDLTFSGSTKEFNKAFDLVLKPICEKAGINIKNVFICPGNHEIIRNKCQGKIIRTYLSADHNNVTEILSEKNKQYKLLISAFTGYKSFHNKHFPDRPLVDPGLFYVVNLGDLPFSIISVNTAWAGYGGKEDRDNLFIGMPQITAALDLVPPNNTLIILGHHPLIPADTGWFADSQDSYFSLNAIQGRSSFIFSGHVHRTTAYNLVSSHKHIGVSQAGAFFIDEWHPHRPLSFSAGWIDMSSSTFRTYSFFYQPSEDKWVQVGDTEVQQYRSPASSKAPKDKDESHEAKPKKDYPSVRAQDYENIVNILLDFKDSISILWVQGFPGVGKTTFAFCLSEVLFNGEKPIHIQREDENDLQKIARAIRINSPIEWFNAWKKHGKEPKDELSKEELFGIIAHIITTTDLWFVVEAGESYNETEKPDFCSFLNIISSTNTGLRAVVTTREIPKSISQPPNTLYKLSPFSFEDTKILTTSRTKCTEGLIEAIYNRFHGHPLSICAFLAQIVKPELTESDEYHLIENLEKIPYDTTTLLESLWGNLSQNGKRVISAISEIPELGIPAVASICEGNELEKSGLLSTYPYSSPDDVRFYIHPLVGEVCVPLLEFPERQKGKYDSYKAAYDSGRLIIGPKLAKTLIEMGNIELCSSLVQSDGRAWIEVSGIDNSLLVINSLLDFEPNNLFALYLKGLCYLFSGDYHNSELVFRKLYSLPPDSDAFKLAIRSELMECSRRKGKIFDAFGELVELYPQWQNINSFENEWESHFSGVCGFLIAHLMRSLGAYEKAAEIYTIAEKRFMITENLSNAVERMHSQYARGLSQATSSIVNEVNVINNFAKSSVKSDFLLGLASYLYAASQIKKGEHSQAIETLSNARFHFQNFCSLSYDCRMLCLTGIAAIRLDDTTQANKCFEEVIALSDPNSPQHLISASLIQAIKPIKERNLSIISESISNLLKQGKLATAATLISTFQLISDDTSELFESEIGTAVYLLNISDDKLLTQRNYLDSVSDAIVMLLDRLNITSIDKSFPIVE